MTQMRKAGFLFLMLVPILASAGEKDSLLQILKKAKSIEGEYIGITADKSEVYKAASELWNICSEKELVKLTGNKDPEITCYAFLGLLKKNADPRLLEEIVSKHSKDLQRTQMHNGCIEWPITVKDYMEMMLHNFMLDPGIKQQLDSLYINGK
ncbi:MAG TPA: hypothetical protein VI112_04380 [Bacteroidia bacterium]|jgi:hypothetical protein